MKVKITAVRRSRDSGRRMGKAYDTIIDTKVDGTPYTKLTRLQDVETEFLKVECNPRSTVAVVDIREVP